MIYCCFLDKDDDEHIVSYALLRYGLAEEGITDYTIKRETGGKPYIEGEKMFFSIAHTQGLCTVAISKRPVGVDCEAKERTLGELLIKRIFTEEEISGGLSPIILWTLKEAACKLSGRGVAQMLSGIEFNVNTLNARDKSCVGQVYIMRGYVIAACEKEEFAHELIEIAKNELEPYI